MMDGNSGMFFGGGLMWIIWILIAFILIALVRFSLSGGESRKKNDSALEILEKRFARGEIDEEEFNKRRKELED